MSTEAPSTMPKGISSGVRKGVVMFLGGEFTLLFDAGFMRTNRHEYEVFVDMVKKLRQKRYDLKRSSWNFPPADDAVKMLVKFLQWGIVPTKDAREYLSVELKRAAEIEAAAQAATEADVELDIPTAPHLASVLKNYQKVGVKFMATMRRAYNGDEMGLGKSLQTLAALELAQAYPALIICPVKLKKNWLAEARQWLPKRSVSLTVNTLADITILAYTEIHNHVNFELASPKKKERDAAAKLTKKFFFPDIVRLRGIACDEGHFIKRGESRRTMACKAIAQVCDSPVRFVMSGTPIENYPAEMIAPLEFLGRMDQMGGWYHFVTRWCGAVRNNFGLDLKGATNTREFHEKLTKVCYIRRKKKEVLKELPDKIEAVYEAEIDNESEYRRIERDTRAFLIQSKGALLTDGQMQALAMLKVGMLRKAAGMGKVAWIIEWVDTFLESGEKFVLYAYHPEVQSALVKGLARWNPATVLGGCKDVKAEQDKFMKDETCRLFIGSIVAAGFGLTLTRASHIGIAELMWTHTKHQQVVDRVHRIGQKDCVNAYYFLAPGTIDDDMWELVSEKAKIVASTTDGDEVAQSALLKNLVRKFLT